MNVKHHIFRLGKTYIGVIATSGGKRYDTHQHATKKGVQHEFKLMHAKLPTVIKR